MPKLVTGPYKIQAKGVGPEPIIFHISFLKAPTHPVGLDAVFVVASFQEKNHYRYLDNYLFYHTYDYICNICQNLSFHRKLRPCKISTRA